MLLMGESTEDGGDDGDDGLDGENGDDGEEPTAEEPALADGD